MASIHVLSAPEIKAAKPSDKIIMMAGVFVRTPKGKQVNVVLGSYPEKARGVDPDAPLKAARARKVERLQNVVELFRRWKRSELEDLLDDGRRRERMPA